MKSIAYDLKSILGVIKKIPTKLSQLTNDMGFVSGYKVYYGTCNNDEDEAYKTITTTNRDFKLEAGNRLSVRFKYFNRVHNAYFNVDNTGDKQPIISSSDSDIAYLWNSGDTVDIVYDGTNYVILNKVKASNITFGNTRLVDNIFYDVYTPNASLAPKGVIEFRKNYINNSNLYDSNNRYAIGTRVFYNNALYECIQNISTPEVWNSNHWKLVDTVQTQIDKIAKDRIFYGECNGTSGDLILNVSTETGEFVLYEGARIQIRFNNEIKQLDGQLFNRYLNIDNTGDIHILSGGDDTVYIRKDSVLFTQYEVVDFVYTSDTINDYGYAVFAMSRPGFASTTTAGITAVIKEFEGSSRLTTPYGLFSDQAPVRARAIEDAFEYIVTGATAYNSNSTYDVGSRVRRGNIQYVCISAISTPEPFDTNHWQQLDDLQTQLDDLQTQINNIAGFIVGLIPTPSTPSVLHGSYVGTGSNSTVTITLSNASVTPFTVLIFDTTDLSTYPMGILTPTGGLAYYSQTAGDMRTISISSTVSNNTISWTAQVSPANHILNNSGVTYQYVAFVKTIQIEN